MGTRVPRGYQRHHDSPRARCGQDTCTSVSAACGRRHISLTSTLICGAVGGAAGSAAADQRPASGLLLCGHTQPGELFPL